MMRNINNCPRCNSKIKIVDIDGDTFSSLPIIALKCSNKDCLWNMTHYWNHFGSYDKLRDNVLEKMITQWNEGINKNTKFIADILNDIREMYELMSKTDFSTVLDVLNKLDNKIHLKIEIEKNNERDNSLEKVEH